MEIIIELKFLLKMITVFIVDIVSVLGVCAVVSCLVNGKGKKSER